MQFGSNRSSVEPLLMSQEGYCYLIAVREEYREEVARVLGPWPTVFALLSQPEHLFVSTGALRSVRVELRGCRLHCSLSDCGSWVDAAPECEVGFVTWMRIVIAGGWYGALTLADRLARDCGAVEVTADLVAAGLATTVGGLVEPVRPGPGADAEAISVFNRATMVYNWALLGQEAVSKGLPVPPLGQDVVESGDVGVKPVAGLPAVRGPNWLRNRANRMEKKVRKEERKAAEQARGLLSTCDGSVRTELRDTRAQALILRNKREILEEQRKLDKLNSPMAVVRDVVEHVKAADVCRRIAEHSEVAGWAQTVLGSHASSVVKSQAGSLPSLSSVTSARSLEQRRARIRAELTLERTPPTEVERAALDSSVLTRTDLYDARCRALRVLGHADFVSGTTPFKLTRVQAQVLRNAENRRADRLSGVDRYTYED